VKTSLLNLISTPIPVINSLGLDVAVGLSAEDPIAGRRPPEDYEAYLTLYDPDGILIDRVHLGEIRAQRRRMFDLTAVSRVRIAEGDHLAVAHRVPRRLMTARGPDAVIDLSREDADYAMYRSLVQYGYPGGSNGSVIYETPPGFNLPRPGRAPASTLTFTSKVVLSETVDTCIALMNYSMDPAYWVRARYRYAFFDPDGEQVADGSATIAPFGVTVLSAAAMVPEPTRVAHRDAVDGLTWLTYIGYCRDTAIIPLILTVSRERRTVSVEHTHPAQAYTIPAKPDDKHKVKSAALAAWARRLEEEEAHAAP
jgi:hypothetical protein